MDMSRRLLFTLCINSSFRRTQNPPINYANQLFLLWLVVKLIKSIKKAEASSSESNNYLPDVSKFNQVPPDIWSHIFEKYPAKTLITFRSVCKYWCSIIDNPDFIDMHRKLWKINSVNNRLVVSYNGRSMSVCRADDFTKITTFSYRKFDLSSYRIIGSCNGLFLVRRYDPPRHQKELRLWNPCTRKSLILPTCPFPPCMIANAMYMFGFAPNNKDYKVVAITFEPSQGEEGTNKMWVAVYTLSDQQWTIRNDGLNIDCLYFKSLFEYTDRGCRSNAVYFRGAVHWLGSDLYGNMNDRRKSTHLVSFDIDTEKFSFMELPFTSCDVGSLRVLFLLEESLAIFSISNGSSIIRVLKKGAWTQWFSGFSSWAGYNLFRAIEYSKQKVLYLDSEGGYFISGKSSYNIARCEVQKWNFHLEVERYSESLVLCKEYGTKDLTSCP